MSWAPAGAMPVPDVDVPAARRDAERLRRAARLSAIAAEQISETAPSQWYGGAATSYDVARAELARCVDDVRRLSRTAAEAVAQYADAVAPLAPRMEAAASDLDVGLALKAADPTSPRGDALVEQAWADYGSADRAYQAAVDHAVDAFAPIPAQVSPKAQGPTRHIEAGARRFWEDAVVGPLSFAWDLTGGGLEDRDAWWGTVSALPGAIAEMFRHPVRTLDEAFAGPEWRAGEWGSAIGAMLAGAVAIGRLPKAPDDLRRKHADNIADPNAPKPRLQTLDELLVRPDLDAHEHAELGHTLRRHVNVSDAYLEDRLRYGTLLDNGLLAPPPRSGMASAWADQETATRVIREVLTANEATIRTWVNAGKGTRLELDAPAPASVGRVMRIRADTPEFLPPERVMIVLKRAGGDVFLVTAYPDVEAKG